MFHEIQYREVQLNFICSFKFWLTWDKNNRSFNLIYSKTVRLKEKSIRRKIGLISFYNFFRNVFHSSKYLNSYTRCVLRKACGPLCNYLLHFSEFNQSWNGLTNFRTPQYQNLQKSVQRFSSSYKWTDRQTWQR